MRGRKGKLLLLAALLLALTLPGFYTGLKIRHYTVDAQGLSGPIRILLVSDLHSCRYGEGQTELIRAVRAQDPDLLVLTGDFFDDRLEDGPAEQFLQGVADLPCWYVTGNHEYWSGEEAFLAKMALLDRYGVRRLSGEGVPVTVGGETFTICGVDDPEAARIAALFPDQLSFSQQLKEAAEDCPEGWYAVLLTHRPEEIGRYGDFDLVLCGHAHGGQWRIPGLLNGLYAPGQGLFPAYAGGLYQTGGTTMVVSRGLARESTRIPRFYNRPEVVVIDLI